MISYKRVFRFCGIFIITYSILFSSVSGFRKGYTNYIQSIGAQLYHHIGDDGIVFLWPEKSNASALKVLISKPELRKGSVYHGAEFEFNMDISGVFLPFIFFLSLVAATVLSWKRKFFTLVAGFALFSAYAMLKLYSIILYSYTQNPHMGLFQLEGEKESIYFWYNHFALKETIDYTFVLIVWMTLCIGKKEWQNLSVAFSNDNPKRKKQVRR